MYNLCISKYISNFVHIITRDSYSNRIKLTLIFLLEFAYLKKFLIPPTQKQDSMRNVLLTASLLLLSSIPILAQTDNNSDFYFNIVCSSASSNVQATTFWTPIKAENDTFTNIKDYNLSTWQSTYCTLERNYFYVGVKDWACTSTIRNKYPLPAMKKLVVERFNYSQSKQIESKQLIVSSDSNFSANKSTVYQMDPDASTSNKDVFIITDPIDESYYKFEYKVAYVKPTSSLEEMIQYIRLYPTETFEVPQFFTSEDKVQIISEAGELRYHFCYFDENGTPVAGNTDWLGGNLTSDYFSRPIYNTLNPAGTVAVVQLPETYSNENNVNAKYVTVSAQTYKDGEFSEMVTRTFGDGGSLITGVDRIEVISDDSMHSAKYFDLQGNNITSIERVPAGTLIIRVDAKGASKFIR